MATQRTEVGQKTIARHSTPFNAQYINDGSRFLTTKTLKNNNNNNNNNNSQDEHESFVMYDP
eukprot:scaffold90368_cov48-Attheya_sp.AAC.3